VARAARRRQRGTKRSRANDTLARE
jgi:hypothetical protein